MPDPAVTGGETRAQTGPHRRKPSPGLRPHRRSPRPRPRRLRLCPTSAADHALPGRDGGPCCSTRASPPRSDWRPGRLGGGGLGRAETNHHHESPLAPAAARTPGLAQSAELYGRWSLGLPCATTVLSTRSRCLPVPVCFGYIQVWSLTRRTSRFAGHQSCACMSPGFPPVAWSGTRLTGWRAAERYGRLARYRDRSGTVRRTRFRPAAADLAVCFSMLIFVKFPSGKIVKVDIHEVGTVQDIKRYLCRFQDFIGRPETYVLKHRSCTLSDSQRVTDLAPQQLLHLHPLSPQKSGIFSGGSLSRQNSCPPSAERCLTSKHLFMREPVSASFEDFLASNVLNIPELKESVSNLLLDLTGVTTTVHFLLSDLVHALKKQDEDKSTRASEGRVADADAAKRLTELAETVHALQVAFASLPDCKQDFSNKSRPSRPRSPHASRTARWRTPRWTTWAAACAARPTTSSPACRSLP